MFEYKVNCPDKCKVPCDHQTFDDCIQYTKPSIDCYGIEEDSDQTLGDVVYKVGAGTCSFIKKNINDVSALTGTQVVLPTYEATDLIIDYLGNLNSDQIQSRAAFYCLGSNLSPSGYILQNRGMTWGMQPTGDTSSFYYDLSEILRDLPGDVQFLGADIKVIGRSLGTVMTMHAQATSTSGSFNLKSSMMPGHVEFKMSFSSPTGQIILENVVALGGLGQIGPFSSPMLVKDYGTYQNQGGYNLTQLEEIQSLKICSLDTYVKNLQYVNVSSCDEITYPDKNITTVVGVQGGWLCSHERRLNNIGAEKVSGFYCDETCDKLSYETTLQEWIQKKDEEICELQELVRSHSDRIKELELTVEKILKKLE